MPRQVADTVARHLVAAGELIGEAPDEALAHARAARRLAPRISAVREAVGLTAYHAGEWQAAVADLRTYHRMSGRQSHLAVLADCERALGRPQRAIDIYRDGQRADLAPAEAIELLIVAAGARADLGQPEAARQMLEVPDLSADQAAPWVARLRYAYADALLTAGREAEAREWFERAAAADEQADTDAAERLLELDGVSLEEAEPLESEPSEDEPLESEHPEKQLPGAGPADAGAAAVAEPAEAEQAEAEQAEAEQARESVPAHPGEPAAAGRLVDAYDLVILDLDGVVLVGDQPVPAAVEAIASLRRDHRTVVFATNNASRSAQEVAELLTGTGVPAGADEVLTSGMAAADALSGRLPAGAAVLVVGSDALAGELRRVGLRPVTTADERPAAVVQGYGPEVGWAPLAEAAVAIRAGAQWIVTNADVTLPSPRGPLPGNGALVAALRTALDRHPDLVVGKPEPALFTAAARRHAASAPLVVGDRLDTDIEGAARAGMDSLLVLTGVSDREQADDASARQRPTYLAADLTALFRPARETATATAADGPAARPDS